MLPLLIIIVAGVIALLIFHHPKLNVAHAARVDVTLWKQEEPYTNYLGAITNSADVKNLLSIMARGGPGMAHKCKAAGWFVVRYDDGKTRHINFLPGHTFDRYEYRAGLGVRQMDRQEFLQALQRAGIRTNDFPALDP